MPSRRPILVATAIAVLATLLIAGPAAGPASAEAPPVVHQPPVDAPVVDPFRAPASRFGAGNRGLAYDLAPGTAVRASASGTVVFAGLVAGTRHVTVLHEDGIRTSYSFLEGIEVRRGDRVDAGAALGRGGAGFHFGARVGTEYIDPAALFGEVRIRVRLVPHHEAPRSGNAAIAAEHAALLELVATEQPGLLRRAWDFVTDRGEVLSRWGDVVLATVHTWSERGLHDVLTGVLVSLWEQQTQPCTPGKVTAPAPTGPRVAVLVGGLSSSSGHAAIDDVDTATLGYGVDDAIRFSYAGGRTSGADLAGPLASLPATDYDAADTEGDIAAQGARLADLIQATARARPGEPIDIYAHSMGGLVTRFALEELAHRPGGLDLLGTVVTIGTPHAGADLATWSTMLPPRFGADVAVLADAAGLGIDPRATSVRQMGETSDLIDHLARTPPPATVDFRTIAARGDLVVAADRARVDEAPFGVIDATGPSAHDALPGHPQTTRELQLALAGMPPACRGLLDAVLDAVLPEGVSILTDSVSLGSLLVP